MFIFDNKLGNKDATTSVRMVSFLNYISRQSKVLSKFVMEIIKLITHLLGNAFGSYFSSDMDVMSKEAQTIFSNEEDRKKYIDAVERLKDSPNKEETIILSTNEKITLIS